MMDGLNVERIVNGAAYLGEMREAIRYARQHLERRVQFRQTTGVDFRQPVQAGRHVLEVPDVATHRLLRRLRRATWVATSRSRRALCKLFASDSQLAVAIEAIQCMGGNGVMQIYPAERYLRDAKLNQIAAGTNEILRLLIYRMGNREFDGDLQPPVRVMDEELGDAAAAGQAAATPKRVESETDVLKVLAENYRVNPGLHMKLERHQAAARRAGRRAAAASGVAGGEGAGVAVQGPSRAGGDGEADAARHQGGVPAGVLPAHPVVGAAGGRFLELFSGCVTWGALPRPQRPRHGDVKARELCRHRVFDAASFRARS